MTKSEIEALLNEVAGRGSYSFLDAVPLSAIDEAASAREQVRITRIDPELVERYGVAMLDGAEFPPLLLAQNGSGKYRVIDGNNRQAAYREVGTEEAPAFILGPKVTDLQVEVLKIALNEHGMPHSREERLREAARLVEMGMTQVEAAKVGRVAVNSLRSYVGIQRGKARLTEAGVPARVREELQDNSIMRIGSLRENNVIALTAIVAHEHGVHTEELSKFVAQLSSLRSEAARVKELEAWREELESRSESAKRAGAKPGGRKTTAYSTFMRAAGLLLREAPGDIISTCPDRGLLRDKAEQVARRVKEVLGAL